MLIECKNIINQQTRSSTNSLCIPPKRTDTGKNSMSFSGPKFWNFLPNEIKIITNRNTFKHSIKRKYFIELESYEKLRY